MVHALKRIHRWLRPGGVLLDLHPQPENSAVEFWQDDRVEHLGYLEDTDDSEEILEARVLLSQVEGEGWYVTELLRFFDLMLHFARVEELQEYVQKEYTSELPEELLILANQLLATGGGELVVREPIRASRLKPLPGPGSDGGDP